MSRLSWPRVTLSHIWWALPVLLSYAVLSLTPLREGDLWWHLSLGESIARTRVLPTVDVWTVAGGGLPFNAANSWLGDVVLYALEAVGCLAALVVLQAFLGALTVALLLRLSYLAGAAAKEAAALTLVGFLALYPFSTARPQIFSFSLFMCVEGALLAVHAGRLYWLAALPALMAVWVNLHGGWVMGLGLIGAFGMGWLREGLIGQRTLRSLRPHALWGIAVLLATLLNPQGFRVYEYLIVMGTSSISQQFVSEWQPPSLGQTFTWPFWGLLLIGGLLLARRHPRRWDLPTLVALCFVALALRYLRMIPFAVIALLPALSNRLPRRPALPEHTSVFNCQMLGVLLTFSVLTTPYARLAVGISPTTLIDPYFPVAACEVLAQHAPAGSAVFALAEWGGYVGWRLAPDVRPFVDGRVELPPVDVWEDYLAITTGQPGWQERVRGWDHAYLLLSLQHQGRLAALARVDGWQTLYEDAGTLLLAAP